VSSYATEIFLSQAAANHETRMHSPARECFASYYDRHFAPVYNYIRARVVDADLADDLTSQTFEKALRAFGTFDPARGAFAPWILTIAHNTVVNHWRDARETPLDAILEPPSPALSPERSVEQNEEKAALFRALLSLDDRSREIVALKFFARLTNREIAEVTSLTESNVGVILYRALHSLEQTLGKEAAHGR
jgi:RNA polymerase sigma factor (sigma-70 family)